MVPVYKRDRVVMYTGRLERHLYRETTRLLSMTEEFRVDAYTGGSDPTLIQGGEVSHIYRKTSKPQCFYTSEASIQTSER